MFNTIAKRIYPGTAVELGGCLGAHQVDSAQAVELPVRAGVLWVNALRLPEKIATRTGSAPRIAKGNLGSGFATAADIFAGRPYCRICGLPVVAHVC